MGGSSSEGGSCSVKEGAARGRASAAPCADAEPGAAAQAPSRHPFLDRYDKERRRGRQYSTGEEVANAVTHGVGTALAAAALVLLVLDANAAGGGLKTVSAVVFGSCLVAEYLCSTLYHALRPPRAKAVLRVFDHASIYLLIAGSYAPFTLVTLADDGGLAVFALVWAIAVVGIALEVAGRQRQPKWVSALVYLAMGWLVVFKLPELWALLPAAGFRLLVAGGVSYTAGVIFYLLKRVPYMHMVWHLFVLGGSACHVLAVLLYVY